MHARTLPCTYGASLGSKPSLLRIIGSSAVCVLLTACSAAPSLGLPGGSGSPAAEGQVHYVDGAKGSDRNPGTLSQPWRTIQKAADSLKGGESVQVAAGTYPERVRVTHSGRQGATISFEASGLVSTRGFEVEASYVVVDGFDISDAEHVTNGWGIHLTGSQDVLRNNSIHDMAWGGILLFANMADPMQTNHALVEHNRIQNVGQLGIEVRGRSNIVQYNDISRIMQYVPGIANPPAWVDADGIHFHGEGHVLRGNHIHDISYDQPENPSAHIDCFQTFESAPSQEAASGVLLDANLCSVPTAKSGLAAKFLQANNAQGLTITNNVVYAYLIAIVKDASGLAFINNTFVAPVSASDGQGIQLVNTRDTTIQNNIFANQTNGIGAIYPDALSALSVTAGYNCLWRQGNSASSTGDVTGQDPLFVKPPTDFHLLPGSPCVDRGMPVGVSKDFSGTRRPQGAGFDMGAYELAP